jgi:hypothetical protein
MSILAKADGKNARVVDIAALVERAKDTDKMHIKYKKDSIAAVRQFVARLAKSEPREFQGSTQHSLEKLLALQKDRNFRAYEGDCGSFFVREKLFKKEAPDPADSKKKVQEVVVNADECVAIWNERCKQIVESALRNSDSQKDNEEWKREFINRIELWMRDWEPRFEEYAEKERGYSQMINEEVTITVKSITTKAYAKDGEEYTVILSSAAAQGRHESSGPMPPTSSSSRPPVFID